jgi:hypothetical protein
MANLGQLEENWLGEALISSLFTHEPQTCHSWSNECFFLFLFDKVAPPGSLSTLARVWTNWH